MNIKQLETFYWAARLGNFTAAAERLNLSQSTVSMRIQELEQSLGVKIFDRSHRTARVSPKGKELMIYVERLIDLTTEIQQRISAAESITGLIRVGVAEIISVTWLPKFVRAFHEQYPNIIIEFDVALTMDLTSKLQNGFLDIVLAPGGVPGINFQVESLGSVDFEWLGSPSLDTGSKVFHPKDFEKWPIITLSEESYHHATILEWFKSNNAFYRRRDSCNSLSVIADLTMAGLGVSFLPTRCFAKEIKEKRLAVIKTSPKIPPVECFTMMPLGEFQPITQLISNMAVEISDFQNAPGSKAVKSPEKS